MMRLKLLCTTVITLSLLNGVEISASISDSAQWLHKSDQAYARSSGGRSGGGSFGSRSSSSSSGSRSRSSLGRSSGSGSSSSSYGRSSRYRSGYIYSSSGSSAALDPVGAAIAAIVVILIFVFVVRRLLIVTQSKNQPAINPINGGTSGNPELDNDIVTVSKLQIALLAEARSIQSQLSQASLSADTATPEGLVRLLQESTLALLRTPENWAYVSASSQAVHRHQAEQIFNRLSIEERSKLSAETLVNVGGRTSRQPLAHPDPTEDPAAYIVVTLLIGTEDDKRLFGEVWSKEELQQSLERIAAVPSNYLLKFELLWSPQTETDSLTYDELLSEYTTIVQI